MLTQPLFPQNTFLQDVAIGSNYLYLQPGDDCRDIDVHLLYAVGERKVIRRDGVYIRWMMQRMLGEHLTPIRHLEEGNVYVSPDGSPFKVKLRCTHANTGGVPMVVFSQVVAPGAVQVLPDLVIDEAQFTQSFRAFKAVA